MEQPHQPACKSPQCTIIKSSSFRISAHQAVAWCSLVFNVLILPCFFYTFLYFQPFTILYICKYVTNGELGDFDCYFKYESPVRFMSQQTKQSTMFRHVHVFPQDILSHCLTVQWNLGLRSSPIRSSMLSPILYMHFRRYPQPLPASTVEPRFTVISNKVIHAQSHPVHVFP